MFIRIETTDSENLLISLLKVTKLCASKIDGGATTLIYFDDGRFLRAKEPLDSIESRIFHISGQ